MVLFHIWKDFKRSYSDLYVLKLCLWWAFAFGAYVQVGDPYEYICLHVIRRHKILKFGKKI